MFMLDSQFIWQNLVKNGIKELFFTSDGIVNEYANKTGFEVAPFYHGM